MSFGFFMLFFGSCSGAFLANITTENILHEPKELSAWAYVLFKSSHGHGNLFAMIQILFALSLPHIKTKKSLQTAQSIGLTLGTFTMTVLVYFRSLFKPEHIDILGFFVGLSLSLFMIALLSHSVSLMKACFMQR